MNFHLFVPNPFEIEDGGPDRTRAFVNLSGEPVQSHDEYVIMEDVDEVLDVQNYVGFMHQVRQFLVDEVNISVRSGCIHPLGIALFMLDVVFHCDIMFVSNPDEIDGVRV